MVQVGGINGRYMREKAWQCKFTFRNQHGVQHTCEGQNRSVIGGLDFNDE